jgi:glucokinase
MEALNMTISADPVLGVDVGASTISAGLVCPDGAVLTSAQAPTRGEGSVLDTVFTLIDGALAAAVARGLRVTGIGVGLPGLIDVERGCARPLTAGHLLPELGGLPLRALIHDRTGLPVFVDNDARALTLAEWTFGLGRGASSLVTMTIGTGIGSGMVADGRLIRGHFGSAGEIGHAAVSLTGPRCLCGSVGCLATYLGGRLIPERVQERLSRYPDSILSARAAECDGISARLVFEAAAEGDPLARAVVDEACEALATAIGALVSLLNPEVIVITGGVAASLAPLRDDIMRRARRRALASALDATAVHVTPGDKRDTVRGGAALVLYEMARRQDAPTIPLPSGERAG